MTTWAEVVPSRPVEGVADGLREVMASFPTGVTVVTTNDRNGEPRGMTCSSLCSVTLSPPTLLVSLRSASPTLEALRSSGAFAVNLLHAGGRPTAELFASGAADRFERVSWQVSPAGAGPHLVDDAHAVVDCRAYSAVAVGDHVLVLGQVVDIWQRQGEPPLLYGLREYRGWTAPRQKTIENRR